MKLAICLLLSLSLHVALFVNYKYENSHIITTQEAIINIEVIKSSKGELANNKAEQPKKETPIKKAEKKQEVKKDMAETSKKIEPLQIEETQQEVASNKDNNQAGNNGIDNDDGYTKAYASFIPKPKYPLISRRNKEEGSIIFNIDVDNGGKLVSYKIIKSSGYERLDAEATKSIKLAKFQPALKKGKPISSSFDLKITFSLTDGG